MGARQGPRGVTKSIASRAALERPAIEGDSPVYENAIFFQVAPKYRGTRGTLRESTGTIR